MTVLEPTLQAIASRADPLADNTIERIMGSWQMARAMQATTQKELIEAYATKWRKLNEVTRVMGTWTTNESLDRWSQARDIALDTYSIKALEDYVSQARSLPAWADPVKMERAEQIFMQQGPLSCVLLFCASLPECYVVPDLAAVLHISGQLEAHTDYRIRSTASMIFPIMMQGGMSMPKGSGIAQVLKVRLIHATIRYLILHDNPSKVTQKVEPTPLLANSHHMFHALYAHGWDVPQRGLPCDQSELAYTLLTFNFIYLRSLRKLGLPLSAEDETAFLHCWNVMGHVLGIERELMRDTYDEAEALFTQLQTEGKEQIESPDPRPALGRALMQCMEQEIPLSVLKGIPRLMTCHLCTEKTAALIGVNNRAGMISSFVFWLFIIVTRAVDDIVRLILPQFSLSRLVTRLMGQHFLEKVLMDQTRPLKLPKHLYGQIRRMRELW